jgi:hypothetical protein
MKQTSILAIALLLACANCIAQEFRVSSGKIEVEMTDERKRSRLLTAEGTTKCGYYSAGTSTFFDCNGKSEKAESSSITAAPDCCEKITLSAGTVEISGTLRVANKQAVITGSGLRFNIDLRGNAMRKLLTQQNGSSVTLNISIE